MGPLNGIKIVEFAGIGPGPFAAMMLADMGAEVIRLDRSSAVRPDGLDQPHGDLLNRGRRSIGLDLKQDAGREVALRLVEKADGLVEGFRPGVMERLGLGPDVCLERNPKIVYGRMTGWGQQGPMAHAAGHDINYIALSGALNYYGRAGEKPTPPLNMVGDFGGGGMLMAFGIVCGLMETLRSGKGQVVDAAMVDGSSVLMMMIHSFYRNGMWSGERGGNMLDTGASFYDTYETSDGLYVSIGSIEPQFYARLLELTGLTADDLGPQMDPRSWPAAKEKLTEVFKQKTRAQWCEIMEGSDVCFAPVLDFEEAITHPHAKARDAFVEIAGVQQPAPAPRFSRTAPEVSCPPPRPGSHTDAVLQDWGFDEDELTPLRESKAIA